jgi:hypothetical protein
MVLEWADKAGGQHGDPILHAFAIARDNRRWGEIEVCHASPQTGHPSHVRAVESGGHARLGRGDASHHLQGFPGGQHRRHAGKRSGLDGVDGPAERVSEPLAGEAQ